MSLVRCCGPAIEALVVVGQPRRQAMVMNGCWPPADEGSGHDRWVSENDADKCVLMGHADKCGGMQELKWWPRCILILFISMGRMRGSFCFAAMNVLAVVMNTQQQWRQVWWEMGCSEAMAMRRFVLPLKPRFMFQFVRNRAPSHGR